MQRSKDSDPHSGRHRTLRATEHDLEGRDTSMDPEKMTLEDWVVAANARPTLADENAEGLDETEEEIRRQAEDLPVDTPWRE